MQKIGENQPNLILGLWALLGVLLAAQQPAHCQNAMPSVSVKVDANFKPIVEFSGVLFSTPRLTLPFEVVRGATSPYAPGNAVPGQYFASADRVAVAQIFGFGAAGFAAFSINLDTGLWQPVPGAIQPAQDLVLPQDPYYATVQAADLTGDARSEIFARSVNGLIAWQWNPDSGTWTRLPGVITELSDSNGGNDPGTYMTIQAADVNGDGKAEVFARLKDGVHVWSYDASVPGWSALPTAAPWSDSYGWNYPQYYLTIHAADLNGDGKAEIFARASAGITAVSYDPATKTWVSLPSGPAWSDSQAWNNPKYYLTIHAADLNGDGKAEIFARAYAGLVVASYNPTNQTWEILPGTLDKLSDAEGWGDPEYYTTIQAAHVAGVFGQGKTQILARSSSGLAAWSYVGTKGQEWQQLPGTIDLMSDANGWNTPPYYTTIRTADFTGDGLAEVFARSEAGVLVWQYSEGQWIRLGTRIGNFGDPGAWNVAPYYETIRAAQITSGN